MKKRYRILVLVAGLGVMFAIVDGGEGPKTKASSPVEEATSVEAGAPRATNRGPRDAAAMPPRGPDELVSRHRLWAEVVDGAPCPHGQVLVRATLEPEEPKARIDILGSRGDLVALEVPGVRGGMSAVTNTLVPVTAKLGGKVIATTTLPLELEPCPARLAVGARRVGPTSVRVKVWMFGEIPRDTMLRYDFGQGDTEVTAGRDLTFDYGRSAEGERYVVSVRTVRPGTKDAGMDTKEKTRTGAAQPGLAGFAVVTFPDFERARLTQARFDALQEEQNEIARRRGWRAP